MKEQLILDVLVGPPGSGKSQHAFSTGMVRINQDDQGKDGHLVLFNQALRYKQNIVIDRMNFNRAQRNRYIKPAKEAGYTVRIKVLHTPYEECLRRCNERIGHPTISDEETAKKALNYFFRVYEKPQADEADQILNLGWVDESDSEKVIICDLDGTMAKVDHRLHFVRSPESKPDWKSFFEGMIDDEVNHWCRELVAHMSPTYRVVYATGRPQDYEEHTRLWIQENGLTFPGHKLFMRHAGDYRKDDIVKEQILDFEIKTRFGVLFVIDDRKQVVDMWRSRGLTVLQCAKGEF